MEVIEDVAVMGNHHSHPTLPTTSTMISMLITMNVLPFHECMYGGSNWRCGSNGEPLLPSLPAPPTTRLMIYTMNVMPFHEWEVVGSWVILDQTLPH